MLEHRTVADLIVAIAPDMAELVRLRREIVDLRFKQNPTTPTLQGLIANLPITVRQTDDGKWSSTIDTGASVPNTGTSGSATDVEAFRAAVTHVCRLLGDAWRREQGEDEDDE